MKVYVALNGGYEARPIGVFSDRESAELYCIQYAQDRSKGDVEMYVDEFVVDKEKIRRGVRNGKKPFLVELHGNGKLKSIQYTSAYFGQKLPLYREECKACYCTCWAKDKDEAVEIARQAQREYVEAGERKNGLNRAKHYYPLNVSHDEDA